MWGATFVSFPEPEETFVSAEIEGQQKPSSSYRNNSLLFDGSI